MKGTTYILYSKSVNRYYIGATQEGIQKRLESHNEGKYGGKSYTSMATDWEVYLAIECDDYSHAIRLERKIKSMKSRVYIENLKKYKELIEKIKKETKGT